MAERRVWFAGILAAGLVAGPALAASELDVRSPNRKLHLRLELSPKPRLEIDSRDREQVIVSDLGLVWSDSVARHRFVPQSVRTSPTASGHRLPVEGAEGALLEIDVTDRRLAWRFRLQSSREFTLQDESFSIDMQGLRVVRGQTSVCGDREFDCFHGSHEGTYVERAAWPDDELLLLPALFTTASGRVVVNEMNLADSAGLYLRTQSHGKWGPARPRAPRSTVLRNRVGFTFEDVLEREDHLSRHARGSHALPWRSINWIDSDAELLRGSDFTSLADPPADSGEFHWVRPGFGTDEWITDAKIDLPEGELGFESGVNTRTYEYYIDFAARFGLRYVILDAGWSDPDEIRDINPRMDLDRLRRRARARGIGLIFWVQTTALKNGLEENLDYLKSLGAAGLKVDFIDRDDIAAARYVQQVIEGTRRRQLMLILHGLPRPAGQTVTSPHVLGFESALSHEYNKFSDLVTPAHKLNLVFLRGLSGSYDWEGASFRNLWPSQFVVDAVNPHAQGTRASEIALYVFFESRIQILAGNLGDYVRNPEQTRFLTSIPVVWDEVRPLAATLDQAAWVAKRAGRTWWVAGLSAETTERFGEASPEFKAGTFLKPGRYRWQSLEDCDEPQAAATCARLRERILDVDRSTRLRFPIGRFGGFVGRFEPL